MPEWLNNFEHASVTADNKDSFTKAMGKYETEGDAIVGGYNAQKIAGAAYKLPESLDKLPDDTSRGEFTSGVHKLLNIRHAADMDELKNINLKDGLPDGAPYNEDFANAFKQFVVDEKVNYSDMPKYAKFFNTSMAKLATDMETKREADSLAAAKACNDALIADPDIGSKEKLDVLTEDLTRAVRNDLGLTADEVEEFAEAMVGELTRNKVMAKSMLMLLSKLAKEGTTEGGGGGGGGGGETEQTPYEYKKTRWPKTESMWGKPEDKWETQSVDIRKRAGRKE